MTAPQPDLDIVLFGATGFTGRLVAEYLAQHRRGDLSVGLAGRSRERLLAVREALGDEAAAWEVVVADSDDEPSLTAMAERARVVATTAGPYTAVGLPVVAACASTGTGYVDITGEVLFMRASIDAYDALARQTGARIVHSCGFDSVPSDLGVWDLAQRVATDGEGTLGDTTLVVTRMRGGVSGGTVASAAAGAAAAAADPAQKAILTDPYALSPDRAGEPDLGEQKGLAEPVFDESLGQWVGPFVMAGINTRVVRRTNALAGYPYGRTFRYSEVLGLGSGPDAQARTARLPRTFADLAAGGAGSRPAPGEGPDEESRRRGYFRIEIHARTTTEAAYVERVAAQGDPGYAATCMMVGEAALCLLEDADRLPDAAGVLTPAVGFGSVLVDRLRQAGMTFEAERVSADVDAPRS